MLKEKLQDLDGPDTVKFVEAMGSICTLRERHNLAQVLERIVDELSSHSRRLIRDTISNWYTTPMLSKE